MNNENSLVWFTLIASIFLVFAYGVMVFGVLRATTKANDLTARKRWIGIVLGLGIPLILVVPAFLFRHDVKAESVYLKINNISCALTGMLPFIMAASLFQFSQWAPWFWRNREMFPHDVRKRNKR